MTLATYLNDMRNNKFYADPKEQLWQAVCNGDYVKFKELTSINNTISQDINEYRFGITLLHLLVYNDETSAYTTAAAIRGRQQIAQALLASGADLHAPARESAFGIKIGETPWQMADKYDHLPWYYHEGMRASFVYTGEHVMPIFKQHLGIDNTPSMLTQFRDLCTNHAAPLAALATTTLAIAAVKCYKARLQAKL